jgi:transposase-like protein
MEIFNMKHRQFSDTFKSEAVRRANTPGTVKASVAKELDITSNILHRWIREAEDASNGATFISEKKPQHQVLSSTATARTQAIQPPVPPRQTVRHIEKPDQVNSIAATQKSLHSAELEAELVRVTQEAEVLKKTLSFYFTQNI